MKVNHTILMVLILFFGLCCNPGKIKIGEPVVLGEVPSQISEIESKKDPFLSGLKIEMEELPGHDDLIFDSQRRIGYASGMDGWVWKLDEKTGMASRWVRPPVNPAGMQFANKEKNKILVCASRLGGESYEPKDRVGLYEIDIESKVTTPLLLDLPKTDTEEFPKVYTLAERPTVFLKDLNASNSRPFSLCNDLAVSKDGDRIYISEPFEREDAAMGSGAVPEAIGLYPHGKLWMLDRKRTSVSLLLNGFTFVDGILLEEGKTKVEESVVITETTRFRILRAFVSGKNEGTFEILFENLPGLADGLERDAKGNIWVGLIKRRSGLVDIVHKNPWIKPFLLSLPQGILPISKKTGILVLNVDGKKALYHSMHDGSKINDISVAVPFQDRVYFPTFDKKSRGLYSLGIDKFSLGE
ncbi:SMP-30/gluconolactonase/LRE family protein [Leptospira stimsonii]|uniref:SMP-30/gluconolaconase/LRE-like region n=1 Tax=Leptospira stimsonii TaxID=2202203 RepID=A0ABY2NEQ7_9LEPT|nr:SMP-30/gluconolactonase/LRE family protein [Leptospira stimsonii]TGK15328.1 SMP-30/gluconolaconase/LRE-like region [Leptospira stimsonii]TGM22838.1 SMP-30/gluconolaconase/LRE-like region [Leptospira stimsonii]